MSNKEAFREAYMRALADAIVAHPDEYGYPVSHVPVVVEKMMAAIDRGSFNKDGYAIKAVCKELGIKHTYTAIKEYINAA